MDKDFMSSLKQYATSQREVVPFSEHPITRFLGPPSKEYMMPKKNLEHAKALWNAGARNPTALPAEPAPSTHGSAASMMSDRYIALGYRGPLASESRFLAVQDYTLAYDPESVGAYLESTYWEVFERRTFDLQRVMPIRRVDQMVIRIYVSTEQPVIAEYGGVRTHTTTMTIKHDTRDFLLESFNIDFEHDLEAMALPTVQAEWVRKNAGVVKGMRRRAVRMCLDAINNDEHIKRADLNPFMPTSVMEHKTLPAILSEHNHMAFSAQKGRQQLNEMLMIMRKLITENQRFIAKPDVFLVPDGFKLLLGSDPSETQYSRRGPLINPLLAQGDASIKTLLSEFEILEVPEDGVHDRQAEDAFEGTMMGLSYMSGGVNMSSDLVHSDGGEYQSAHAAVELLNMKKNDKFLVTLKDALRRSGMFLTDKNKPKEYGKLNDEAIQAALDYNNAQRFDVAARNAMLASEMMIFRDYKDAAAKASLAGTNDGWAIGRRMGDVVGVHSIERMVQTMVGRGRLVDERVLPGLEDFARLSEELSDLTFADEHALFLATYAVRKAFEKYSAANGSKGLPANEFLSLDLPLISKARDIAGGEYRVFEPPAAEGEVGSYVGPDFASMIGKVVPKGWGDTQGILTIAAMPQAQVDYYSSSIVQRARAAVAALKAFERLLRDFDPEHPALVGLGADAEAGIEGATKSGNLSLVQVGQMILGWKGQQALRVTTGLGDLPEGGKGDAVTSLVNWGFFEAVVKAETKHSFSTWYEVKKGSDLNARIGDVAFARLLANAAVRESVGIASRKKPVPDRTDIQAVIDRAVALGIDIANANPVAAIAVDPIFDSGSEQWGDADSIDTNGTSAKGVYARLHIAEPTKVLGLENVDSNARAFSFLGAGAVSDRLTRRMYKLRGLSPAQAAAARFFMLLPNVLQTWESLVDRNIRVPANFWLVRPERRWIVVCGSLIATQNFGFLAVHPDLSSVSQTVSTHDMKIQVQAKMKMGPVITDSFAASRTNELMCRQYVDGEDDTWYDATTPFTSDDSDTRVRRSLICMMMPPKFKPAPFCPLKGYYEEETFQDSRDFGVRDEFKKPQRGSVFFYNVLHNLHGLPTASLPSARIPFNKSVARRVHEQFVPTMWAGRWDRTTGRYSHVEEITDKFGNLGSYPGCLNDRSGRMFKRHTVTEVY